MQISKKAHSSLNLAKNDLLETPDKKPTTHHVNKSNKQDESAIKQPMEVDVLTYNHPPNPSKLIPVSNIFGAYKRVKNVITRTPTQKSMKLSEYFGANVYIKREDLQIVRSYKLRGAYNKIISIPESERHRTVFCSSAGNHAQGVAYVCNLLKINCIIYMPTNTPSIKFNAVKTWGKQYVQIELVGDTFDESFRASKERCNTENGIYVHAFDDEKIIEGQGTIAVEILEDIPESKIDFLFFPVGGGGCGAGISSYFKQVNPDTILIGVEPEGSPSMYEAIKQQQVVELDTINTFVDGAAIKKSGAKPFEILNSVLKDIILIPEGHVCTTMMKLFNEEGILVEPAGALAISALDRFKDEIRGKTVVCLISGSNNDLGRMTDIRMLSEIQQGLQYYMFVNFFQKPGALKQFIIQCLGPTDEITNLEYTRKNNREKGPALVGVKVKKPQDFEAIKNKMEELKITLRILQPNQEIFKMLL
ncbi:unnamed protein product [Paramecium octaurelia]|uniref:Threonine dehydratase n=1 Tax=Paramecium octaurelia TaxID=43137 RepID=A0A8S1UYN5_PAROT|nr:unnamed protein product [Paramecium octaurelia]